ncbi:hypothetical protein Q361_1335 [Flavobacterium croceum DSM 17960]|uniref:Methylamine utilisation protein MauE domain-containing protein n=1 Tax=Flavobacterium croceum DSM 17960 TaxID=1121886 RepID=A0A2S4N4Q5_9FLAO|nr:MauE/DoxX family redox-associated membrane protein [Flavobacterium croceum]POS00666.1 hypothetical protein Q361_1335 [Flavobacterium croceum DSM 17960]
MKYKLLITFRFLLIVMFSYTLIHKLFDMETFMDTLKKSTIIEDNQIELIFYIVPILEFSTILTLFFWKRIEGFYFSFILMLLFTIYLIALNNFSLYKGCSCGGIFNKLSYFEHLVVNFFFIFISLISIILFEKKE